MIEAEEELRAAEEELRMEEEELKMTEDEVVLRAAVEDVVNGADDEAEVVMFVLADEVVRTAVLLLAIEELDPLLVVF